MAFKRLCHISLKNYVQNIIIYEHSEKNKMPCHYLSIRQRIDQCDYTRTTIADGCL